MSFSNNLKKVRMLEGLTLEELATKTGTMNAGTFSAYENGRQEPLVSSVVILAKALGVSVDYLVGIKDQEVEDIPTFGERLTALRIERGLKQNELAVALDITPTRLNYWEKDKREPNIEMLIKIADYFDISIDFLVGRSQEEFVWKNKTDSCGIKHFRKMKGLTQEELAEISGVSPMTIRRYENGDRYPKPKVLKKIADALGVTISDLFLK